MHYHWLGQLCAVFFMQCKFVQTFFFLTSLRFLYGRIGLIGLLVIGWGEL